ncbi:MAG: putative membrane protein, partial [Spirosomataceae bacterium]
MFNKLQAWIKRRYYDTVNSIAFYPAFIALVFLGVAYGSITLDFSELGKSLKSTFSWLTLRDADTARVIISTILAGILSLTVFSFSMVMIVLNQAASQMSNRILDKLIGNRFQQMILGVYIGTIVFALFLLSTIRDIESHLYIPVLSTYLLIIFAVFDIFLFIYFLHYITQSVKYEVIINRIYDDTKISMDAECTYDQESTTS